MKIKIKMDGESTSVLHNERQNDGRWGYKGGFDADDLGLDIKLDDLYYLVENNLINKFVAYLKMNAEMQLRAYTHKEEEIQAIAEEEREEQRRIERANPKPKRSAHGHVYLLRADNGLYKIGKAKNLTARVTDLGIRIPMKIELIHSFEADDYSTAELALHEKYKNKRDVGEWFALNEDDVAELMAITTEVTP